MNNISTSIKLLLLTIFSISVMLSLSFRKHWFKTDPLTLLLHEYTGNQLRLDGYFYKNDFRRTYFFYRNGIILAMGAIHQADLTPFEERLLNGEALEVALKYKFSLEVFVTERSIINFERWNLENPPLLAKVVKEALLNATTFHISQSYRFSLLGKKREIRVRDEFYHFRHLSPAQYFQSFHTLNLLL